MHFYDLLERQLGHVLAPKPEPVAHPGMPGVGRVIGCHQVDTENRFNSRDEIA
jgi:hypothetical protein